MRKIWQPFFSCQSLLLGTHVPYDKLQLASKDKSCLINVIMNGCSYFVPYSQLAMQFNKKCYLIRSAVALTLFMTCVWAWSWNCGFTCKIRNTNMKYSIQYIILRIIRAACTCFSTNLQLFKVVHCIYCTPDSYFLPFQIVL